MSHFGYAPSEALHAAPALGGQIVGLGDALAQVREDWLADLLQDKKHLHAVMKDGRFQKSPDLA